MRTINRRIAKALGVTNGELERLVSGTMTRRDIDAFVRQHTAKNATTPEPKRSPTPPRPRSATPTKPRSIASIAANYYGAEAATEVIKTSPRGGGQ